MKTKIDVTLCDWETLGGKNPPQSAMFMFN